MDKATLLKLLNSAKGQVLEEADLDADMGVSARESFEEGVNAFYAAILSELEGANG